MESIASPSILNSIKSADTMPCYCKVSPSEHSIPSIRTDFTIWGKLSLGLASLTYLNPNLIIGGYDYVYLCLREHSIVFVVPPDLSTVGGVPSLSHVERRRGGEDPQASPLREAWLNRDSDGLVISRELELRFLLLRILGVLV